MEAGLYANRFSQAFQRILEKTGVSCYQISQYTGLDQAYLSRLKKGVRNNPSVETIMKISLAIACFSTKFSIRDAENLFNSIGRSLIPKRSHRYT